MAFWHGCCCEHTDAMLAIKRIHEPERMARCELGGGHFCDKVCQPAALRYAAGARTASVQRRRLDIGHSAPHNSIQGLNTMQLRECPDNGLAQRCMYDRLVKGSCVRYGCAPQD